jgi:hypothetical protein
LRTSLEKTLGAAAANFAGDARATLFFVSIFERVGDLANEVDTAAVTREESSPRNAFFVG